MKQTFKDKIGLFAILLFVLLLNSYGLGVLEFIRHTEADRTLIAWEMVESGNFLVPHLIHSTILTKPPLYYWVLATAISIAGGVSEYVVRMPSVIISVLFVLSHYLFWKRAGATSSQARFASIVLFSGMSFFILSTAAEIDMLFSFLCMQTFYFSYFAIKEVTLKDTVLSYLFATLAFLTKGPPIVFFFLAIHFGFWLFTSLRKKKVILKDFIVINLLGGCLFLSISSFWLYQLASEVGWSEIVRQFQIEVLQRIAEEKHLPRGYFFYFGSVVSGLLPWSIFLILGIMSWIYSWIKKKELSLHSSELKSFFQFNLFAFTVAFLMLTIAKGKSDRYIFPVYACLANVVPFAFYELQAKGLTEKLFKTGGYLFPILAVAGIVSVFFVKIPGVSSDTVTYLFITSSLLCLWFFYACRKSNSEFVLYGVLILIVIVRLFYVEIYSVSRNSMKSVKSIAFDINEKMPEGEVLYNIELFERWITYYLKHLGRQTYRLTPAEVRSPRCANERCFVLLNLEEEKWRLEQLKTIDPELQILSQYKQGRDDFLLIAVKPVALTAIRPEEDFPTVPTLPFF